ncbi:MAG: EamA family transporter [Gammaproteobacteria bacterium]|nr:EamA family transporter [Gammaproteobacteria bacterium]
MIYSFLYVFIFSIALILIQKLDITIPPLFSLLVTTIIASIYFNMINRKSLKKIYTDCFQNKKEWFSVMLIVLIMWSMTMIGPGKIGASLFNFIYFAWLGTLGFLSLNFQDPKKYNKQFYFAVCLGTLIIVNILIELKHSFSFAVLTGIALALAGGTSSFIYFKKSQILARSAHLSATQVLAVRFYLSIIFLLFFLPTYQVDAYLTLSNSFNLILLAFFSLIIPLYFSQKALEKITPEQHAIINSLCPLITGILQEITFNDLKNEQFLIYLLYSAFVVSFYFINKLSTKLEISR